jgi:hypothetical protein
MRHKLILIPTLCLASSQISDVGESEHIFPPGLQHQADREHWWNSLSTHWQHVFKETGFGKRPEDEITDAELALLCSTCVLRIMGPTGSYPNFSGTLSDLRGLQALTNIEYLFVMHCELESLDGIENLSNLKSLFVSNNRLTTLEKLQHHPQLEELYAGGNRISSLLPLRSCTNLHTLYCENNALTSLEGITGVHEKRLKQFVCKPNSGISDREIIQFQNDHGILCH